MKERPPSLAAHLAALGALGALLAISVIVARFHLGVFNTIAGPAIAALKAAIVVLFFMKLREGSPAKRFALCFGLVWIAILIALTLNDLLTRVPVQVL